MKLELLKVARAVWLVSLGVLTASSVTVRALADPHWSPATYSYYGSTKFSLILPNGQTYDRTFDWPEDRGYSSQEFDSGYGADVLSAGTIVASMSWVDDDGNAAPNPPKFTYVQEDANAECGYTFYSSGSVAASGDSASEGMGDSYRTYGPDAQGQYRGWSSGTRFTKVDSSSGVIVRSVTMSAHIGVMSPSAGPSGNARALCTYSLAPRSHVWIYGPDIEDSYYNDGGIRNVHLRDDDGGIITDAAAAWDPYVGDPAD